MDLAVYCRRVICDFRYDFSEKELGFCFDDSSPGVFCMFIYMMCHRMMNEVVMCEGRSLAAWPVNNGRTKGGVKRNQQQPLGFSLSP